MSHAMTIADLLSLQTGPPTYALIDVREMGEFNLGHIPYASPAPRGDLEWRIGELVPSRTVLVILYCEDGRRSTLAAGTLEKLGYCDVRYLAGGLEAWRAAGQPTVEGWGTPSREYGEKVALEAGIPEITPQEVIGRQKQGERFIILDSRTVAEYEQGHLPGAYSVPLDQLPLEVGDLVDQVDPLTVVVNCAGRTRSILGAHVLRRMGLSKVAALRNGTTAWQWRGYPLEHGFDPRSGYVPSLESRVAAEQFADRVRSEDQLQSLQPKDLQVLQQSGELHYVIDVRQPAEYAAGHIPGAIPGQSAVALFFMEQIVGVRGAPIVMTCDGRVRAILAASLYRRMGYPRVLFLDGGTAAWAQAGLPLTTGQSERSVPGLHEARARVAAVAPAELERRLRSTPAPIILDVRGSGDYAMGHLPGARWLSRGYLELRVADLVPDRRISLVTVCNDGVRSALAAATLLDIGYSDVTVLEGGVSAWEALGFPLEEGLNNAPVTLDEARGDADPFRRRGVLARTREEMEKFLLWEENLGRKQ